MTRFLTFLLALIFLSAAGPVGAQQTVACGLYEQIIKGLLLQYKELPTARGLAANGSLIEILTSPDGETWTMIMMQPSGMACVMATGEGWQVKDYKAPEQGS